ncbi:MULTISPECIES: hypothetical protein [Herbaspirillum]|uniref:Uncharacterized protein n=2 Tax=Herbaspirillum huttiense TaxID=863372 RepID=A0AAJ2LRF4_9BURK|nr:MULTISPECIES: hypothetical protein [Herbaspirillum]MDR9836717.1 hypothetical protein [Herbaspirillum huttiense]
MKQFLINVPVKAPSAMAAATVADLVQQLLAIGVADARATVEDCINGDEGDVEAAKSALDLEIGNVIASPAAC